MNFISIRVRTDNLMYLFYTDTDAFSVDAYCPTVIIHALGCEFHKTNYTADEIKDLKPTVKQRKLTHTFTTHSHYDHAGGDLYLQALSPSTRFISYQATKNLDIIQTPVCPVKSIFTPSHTMCSVSYLILDAFDNPKYLLTGDFLFKLGCGRFFEGTGKDFLKSLENIYEHCDDSTVLLYGHDYYETNRKFTEQFFKPDVSDKYFLTLAEEKKYNPFLNYEATGAEGKDDSEKVEYLRKLKDAFT